MKNIIRNKITPLILLLAITVSSQKIKVPVELQMTLIPKIIAFDNNFDKRTEKENVVKVGLLYSNIIKSSMRVKDQIQKIIETIDNTIRNREIKYEFIEIEELEKYLETNTLYAIYLMPLRVVDVGRLAELFKKEKVLSISGIDEYFKKGLSVYFDLENNKPSIVINLENSQKEGVELSSHLLKICDVK